MSQTATVKSIDIKDGRTKDGAPWERTVINTTTGETINTFEHLNIQEGDEFEYEPEIKGKYTNIKQGTFKLISHTEAQSVPKLPPQDSRSKEIEMNMWWKEVGECIRYYSFEEEPEKKRILHDAYFNKMFRVLNLSSAAPQSTKKPVKGESPYITEEQLKEIQEKLVNLFGSKDDGSPSKKAGEWLGGLIRDTWQQGIPGYGYILKEWYPDIIKALDEKEQESPF